MSKLPSKYNSTISSKDINELSIYNVVNISNLYLSNIKKAKSVAIIVFLI